MRGSTRIGHRLNREKLIGAARIGRCGTVTLEIFVARLIGPTVPDIMVAAVRVALPNLDPCSRNGASVWIENAPGDPHDRALSRPLVPGDMDQVVIGILRKALRVKRARGLPWGRWQHACGARGQSEQQ